MADENKESTRVGMTLRAKAVQKLISAHSDEYQALIAAEAEQMGLVAETKVQVTYKAA